MNFLKPFVEAATEVGGKFIADKTKLAEFTAALQMSFLQTVTTNEEVRSKVITAEAQGESWLQRNWRPVLMLTIVAIVFNNYMIAPYVELLFGVDVVLPLPERMWDLMTLGVGGYIAGRSVEKTVSAYLEARKEEKK